MPCNIKKMLGGVGNTKNNYSINTGITITSRKCWGGIKWPEETPRDVGQH
jgi:hypothetical protein